MTKKRYTCSECGFTYPSELSEIIDERIQVYCEKCGTPFSIKGVVFKPFSATKTEPTAGKSKNGLSTSSKYQRNMQRDWPEQVKFQYKFAEKDRKILTDMIQGFNKFSSIPLFIISFVIIGWLVFDLVGFIGILFIDNPVAITIIQPYLFNLMSRGFFGFGALFIARYDSKYISKKIEEKKYNEIMVDAFCLGILGSIYYGIGVPLLLKGVAIAFYNILEHKNIAHRLKNSLNNFSAKAGFIIILLILAFFLYNLSFMNAGYPHLLTLTLIDGTKVYWGFFAVLITGILLLIGFIILLIDMKNSKRIYANDKINMGDAIPVFIIGIIGVASTAIGIFILLKGIVLLFMAILQPQKHPEAIVEADQKIPEQKKEKLRVKEFAKKEVPSPPLEEFPKEIQLTKQEEKMIKVHVKKTEKLKKELEKEPTSEKEFELKLHESLLPVSDEKDKELIKNYFTKIFTVLSKDVKNQIKNLKISKKEKKELLEELAFLTKDEQVKYVEAIINMYQEIPKKLIERIKKLPNVKPKHYDNIIEQLKYLDSDEQLNFIQFLEENA